MSRSKRSGFTLVELLVVISIIGMLMALLLPAVGAATENARSLRCKNRLKQLATAMASYESRFQRFPGYVNGQEVPGADDRPLTWVIEIMADLERTDILDQWKTQNRVSMDELPTPMLDFLMCPSDPPLGEGPFISYVANVGLATHDLSGCGMMHTRFPVKNGSNKIVHMDSSLDKTAAGDGASTTILLTENTAASTWSSPSFVRTVVPEKAGVPTNVFMWHNVASVGPDDPRRINGGDYPPGFDPANAGRAPQDYVLASGRPSSEHKGGVNTAFADGHVVFLKETIDYAVYARLMSPDGKKCEKSYFQLEKKTTEVNHTVPLSDTDYR